MNSDDTIELPSGALLSVKTAPFKDARELYKAILREMKFVQIDFKPDSKTDFQQYLLQFFLSGFSSDEIERALWKCMARCLYNGSRIVEDIFEPVEARGDYLKCCVEVAKENIIPFGMSLYAEFRAAVKSMPGNTQKPTSETSTTL